MTVKITHFEIHGAIILACIEDKGKGFYEFQTSGFRLL